MSNDKFSDVLDMPASEVERPKPLPVGTYLFAVTGPHEDKTVGKNNTRVAEFKARPVSAMDDVDRESLADYGFPTEKTVRLSFFLTEDAIYRLKDFYVDVLGKDSEGKTIRQMLSELPGSTFLGIIQHRPSEDGKQFYAEFKSFARA